jgi:intraflagellar transport protein 140
MKHVHWGSNGSVAATISDLGALTFFGEQTLCHTLHGSTAAIQISSNKLILSKPPTHKKLVELGKRMRIKNIALSERHLAVSSGSLIEVFDFSANLQNVESIGLIEMASTLIHLDKSSVIVGTSNRVNICNYQGNVKQFVKIDESEGELSHMDVTDGILLLATTKFVVKVYDISRREPKLILSSKFDEYVCVL